VTARSDKRHGFASVWRCFLIVVAVAICSLQASAQDQQISAGEEMTDEDVDEEELEEISRELSNPVGTLWAVRLENSLTFLRGDPAHAYRGSWSTRVQPAMPLRLTEDWNLILRPSFEFLSKPTIGSAGEIGRSRGIGQTSLVALLSRVQTRSFRGGIGPAVIIPTTTRDELSQRKYSLGVAGAGVYLSENWVVGLTPQYSWSVSGSSKRREVSQATFLYFVWRSLPGGWQIGSSSTALYDRKAKGSNAWTVPIGLGFTRTVRIGGRTIKLGLHGEAAVVHPDDFGPRWSLRFAITPVMKALIARPFLKRAARRESSRAENRPCTGSCRDG
jgi:hypothetical protein